MCRCVEVSFIKSGSSEAVLPLRPSDVVSSQTFSQQNAAAEPVAVSVIFSDYDVADVLPLSSPATRLLQQSPFPLFKAFLPQ